ncbi:MAG TPA: methylated-DNA--[protein]-cysteine S-methyltransferase [Burkholderiales bacterium]|nr:methylated-DNA--[protein]-cysteine S-methyltransferase [Burkholderiales bacterium]
MKRARVAGADFQAKLPTPFALLGIRTEGGFLAEIAFLRKSGKASAPRDRLAERACAQLERYLDDPEFRFDLPLARQGTPFRRSVWKKIAAIDSGRTRSYGEIARELGSAPRAVGQACGANPVPLVIPCHRVVALAGIGGFAHHEAGFHLAVKHWLLAHEGAERRR